MAETKMDVPSYTLAHPTWHMHASGNVMSMMLGVIPYSNSTAFAVLQRSLIDVRALLYLDDVTTAVVRTDPRGVSEVVTMHDKFRSSIHNMLLEIRHCITEIIMDPASNWLHYGM